MEQKIILIVGASGVGKDTLLKACIKHLNEVNIVKRYITRMPDENEKNHYLTKEEFTQKCEQNTFVSFWHAHGNSYGIAREDIQKGLNIISISRGSIKDFESAYENVLTLHITVPRKILKNRLITRARESEEDIEKRLQRSYEKIQARHLIDFDNSESLKKNAKTLAQIIESF